MSTSATFSLPPETVAPSPRNRSELTSDVYLRHTADGGDIEIVGGLVTMSDGLESAVYLSLFGGNERDSGLQADDHLQWWGNLTEVEEDRRYRSETQALLRALPAATANLRRIEDAVARDLSWMKRELLSELEITVTIPRLNAIAIEVAMTLQAGTTYWFRFATGWGGGT